MLCKGLPEMLEDRQYERVMRNNEGIGLGWIREKSTFGVWTTDGQVFFASLAW
jgi:hypothetical protein